MNFELPFHFGPDRVKDVKAPKIGLAAQKAIDSLGANNLALRLLYRTLELDPYNANALITLSAIFRGQAHGVRPQGDEIYSGLLIEYAVDTKSPLSKDQKRKFDKARLEIMVLWGFTGAATIESDVDHIGYLAFINELLSQVGSFAGGFKKAHQKIGLHAGILDPAKLVPTTSYKEWLASPATTLNF